MKKIGFWSGMLLVVGLVALAVSAVAVTMADAFTGPTVSVTAPAEESSLESLGSALALLFSMLPFVFGITLAANKPRAFELGTRNDFAVIAADIIYEGAAVGIVAASGHAQPLANPNRFAGFAEAKADNSAGAAAAINVRVVESGKIQLAVTGAVITDGGQPVYATDDDTFTFNPVAGVFVGFVHRFVSAGVAIVAFDALNYQDPWAHYTVRELLSGVKTFDAEDTGKLFVVDSAGDGAALTLPAIATGLDGLTIMAVSAFGTTQIKIDPAAVDMILGPDITGADNKDLLLTKATQRRGDFVTLGLGDADGYSVTALRGIWAREA